MQVNESRVLLLNIFLAGLCSIIYELLIATATSYFLGDSITQFSVTIGVYMATMGVGSYVSKWVKDEGILPNFISFELMLALVGGVSVPLIYFSYSLGFSVQAVSVVLTAIIGVLVGLEIPLLSRLMAQHYSLKSNLANVLSIDYLGALLATLLFPFVLLPTMGIFKSSLLFGLVNLLIAASLLWLFKTRLSPKTGSALRVVFYLVLTLLLLAMFYAKTLNALWQQDVFEHRVVHSEQSQYQRLIVTKHKEDIRLYLNGNLQFSSIDEHRYHEALVHPALSRSVAVKNVLLLGAGDGLAIKQLLKYPEINRIDLVDLDPAVTQLAANHHYLNQVNEGALGNEKVNIIHQDAFRFVDTSAAQYDLVIIDLPDPKTIALARLYSLQFYQKVRRILNPQGIVVTQATSPFFAQKAFWSIQKTVETSGFQTVLPYHINVPSFGEWGFVMACKSRCEIQTNRQFEGQYYTQHLAQHWFHFPPDLIDNQVEISTLDSPKLLHYYLDGWRYWN